MGSSERDLKRICIGADVVKGLPIHGAESSQSEKQVAEWAKNSVK